MKGADEYASLFKTGQYGKLYLTRGSHARGPTFHIHVLPADEKAIVNGPSNPCINRDAVEVYGIIGGNPGWTETYGWLHEGSWQEDFYKLVEEKKQEIERLNKEQLTIKQTKEDTEKNRIKKLLSDY